MKKTGLSIRVVCALLVLWLMVSACGMIDNITGSGQTQTETQSVELGSAEAVTARIFMGAGELAISGGASDLMDGTFTYNEDRWKPQISYTVDGSQGDLVVEHQDNTPRIVGTIVNTWEMSLNETVPMDLQIETGAGQSELDLHALNLTGLDISIGAGAISVDLSGNLDHDLHVTINGGVGNLSVRLPEEMGVQVTASTGIGGLTNSGLTKNGDGYVNAAYGNAPYTLYLTIDSGIGTIELLAP